MLDTQYRLHQIEAVVEGLPDGSFSTTEGAKEHFWEWQESAKVEGHAKLRKATPEQQLLKRARPLMSALRLSQTSSWQVKE